jgi:hypothetical protein
MDVGRPISPLLAAWSSGRIAPAARPFAALGYVSNGPVVEGLIEVENLVLVVVYDETLPTGKLALRLAGFSAARMPWGIQWGGAKQSLFFKDLLLRPVPQGCGRRLNSSYANLIDLGLKLDRQIERHCRYPWMATRKRLLLPRLWAGFRSSQAAKITGDGPELAACAQRTGQSPAELLARRKRTHEGLTLFPLEWVSHEWQGMEMQRIPSTAAAIQRQIAERQQDNRGLNLPEGTWADMQRLRCQIDKARRREWHQAARRLTEEFSYQADNCHYRLLELLATLRERTNSPAIPSQAEILQEILALQKEFDEVELEPKTGTISVTVGPITLEDVHFGRFTICLDWEGASSSSSYRVVALDPNPAASNDSVTHPHVQDERLCEGEGRAAIRAAIAQGRLLDFFTIVSQTLLTYARGSAYVELDRWDGESCHDCGRTVYEDERYYCHRCGEILCGECSVACQGCDTSYCSDCISVCHECHDDYCSSCLRSCSACHQATCSNCLQGGLCGSCHEKRRQQRSDDDSADRADQRSAERPDAEAWIQSVLEGECQSVPAVRPGAAL